MFYIEKKDQTFNVRMSASLEHIDRADDELLDWLVMKEAPYDFFCIRILLRESVLNAVVHGSHEDPSKEVTLEFTFDEQEARMVVKDDGAGFPWRDRPCQIDTLTEGGRGLALMKIYSDNMVYNEKGNEVILTKRSNVTAAANR